EPGPHAAQLISIATAPPAPRPIELQHSDTEAIRTLVRKYRVSGPGGFLEKLFLRGMLARHRGGTAGVPCVAGDQVIFISAKGEVRPCPFFDRTMGRLEDSKYDLRALL